MATYLFTNGDGGLGNLSTLANWANSNSSGGNLGPASQLPAPGDGVLLSSAAAVKTGTLAATSATARIGSCQISGGTFNCTIGTQVGALNISGGTFNGSASLLTTSTVSGGLFLGTANVGTVNPITGGTFNSSVTVSNVSTITTGTFNGIVTVAAGGGEIDGGTFNAAVVGSGQLSITAGTFNSSCTCVAATVTGGTYNGPLAVDSASTVTGVTINDRVSFDGGVTYLYAVTSPAVAAPTKVVASATNLGVTGQYVEPLTSQVKAGVTFGAGLTGTLPVAATANTAPNVDGRFF